MKYENHNSIIALSTEEHKKAALYFKSIYPLYSKHEVPIELQGQIKFSDDSMLRMIESCRSSSIEEMQKTAEYTSGGEYARHYGSIVNEIQSPSVWSNIHQEARSRYGSPNALLQNVLKQKEINPDKIFVPTFSTKKIQHSCSQPGPEDVVELTLMDLNIINTENLEWEQIIELKRDPDSDIKVQRLRSFLFKNYGGKPLEFIKEDIQLQMYDYELACKKHGFDLLTSSLSILVDSKTLLATIGLTAIAPLLGFPLHQLTPVLLAEVIREATKILINISERRMELTYYKRENPLQYLFDVKSVSEEGGLKR